MELNLEQIKAAALAVTAGPWAAYGTIVRDVDGGEDQLAQGCDFEHARYIAAVDPEVVLELVERLERAEAATVTVYGPNGGDATDYPASAAVALQVKMLRDERDHLFREVADSRSNAAAALDLAMRYGQIDGEHHKTWVIDQVCRALLGDKYDAFVAEAKSGEDGPETYGWDVGIAP